MFSWGSNIFSCLPWLKYWPYGVLISCWKSWRTLRIRSMQPKFDQNKKKVNTYSLSWMLWNGQKTISRYCPFNPKSSSLPLTTRRPASPSHCRYTFLLALLHLLSALCQPFMFAILSFQPPLEWCTACCCLPSFLSCLL